MPGCDDVAYLAGQILANAGKLRQVAPGRQQAADALRLALDDAGRAAVGAGAKLALALNFEEFRGLIEHGRDFCILHRHVGRPTRRGLAPATSTPCCVTRLPRRTRKIPREPARGMIDDGIE